MVDATLAVYAPDACLDHRMPDGAFELPASELVAVDEPRPERPERIENIRHIVERTLGDRTDWPSAKPASRAELETVHEPAYVERVAAASADGPTELTPTTVAVEATFAAARAAAGAAMAVADHAVEHGPDEVPYALVRPPGHHAQPTQADGFCFFNNVALAAERGLAAPGVERVAVVDWDVHPGNGTQACFYDRDDVLVVSLHNDFGSWGPSHPQTGRPPETGEGTGEGYTVNVPLAPGTGDRGYAYAFDTIVEPVVETFDPDLLLVSAGQDPGVADPTARNMVTMDGFRDLSRRVRQLASAHADGRFGLIQEGGYQLSHLPFATLGALEGAVAHETGVEDPFPLLEELEVPAREWIDDAARAHAAHWPLDRS